jgi:hypothetical protein
MTDLRTEARLIPAAPPAPLSWITLSSTTAPVMIPSPARAGSALICTPAALL